jgi:hypothetical protein
MRAHNLIRVVERPATDAADVQRAANARHQLGARPRLAAAFGPEDRAQARRLLRQYRVARAMHLRLQQREVHLLHRCFRALATARYARLAGRARRALRRFRLAVLVHKRLARQCMRAMWGPFRALDALRRMARWVPRLLIVWRQWVCGCARQRRANMLVTAVGSTLFQQRHGRAWALPSGGRHRQAVCVGCGL